MKHLKFPKNKSKIKNRILKGASIFFFIFVLFNIINYSVVFGAGKGIWKNTQCAEFSSEGGPTIPCDFCDAIIVAKNIMDYIIKYVIVIGGIMIVVGGVFLMISMGPSGSKDLYGKGIKSIRRAVIGVVIALFSYLIVSQFLHILTGDINKLPWTSISCKHNEAYKDVGKLFENLNNEVPGVYAKIANDGKFACSSSIEFLKNNYSPTGTYVIIRPVEDWKKELQMITGYNPNAEKIKLICGYYLREVVNKKGIIYTTKDGCNEYFADVVYAKFLSTKGKYVCSTENCYFTNYPDLKNTACQYFVGRNRSDFQNNCENYDSISNSLRVGSKYCN
jgi:hypothetical protein